MAACGGDGDGDAPSSSTTSMSSTSTVESVAEIPDFLPEPGSAVVVGVSGGADSLALAASLAFVAGRAAWDVTAVVVDHGLQPGSADVAARAAEQCRDLGLAAEVVTVEVGQEGGPEAAARAARHAALREHAAQLGAAALCLAHTLDDQAETVLLRLARGTGIDGLAVMTNETPMARDMIARMKARGVAVVALITDQPNSERDHFVGIDNLAAGRTAAVLMGRFVGPRKGNIAVVVNTMQARDMVERRIGFDQVMAQRFPDLNALPTVEGRDDHTLTARVVAKCLDNNDDVVGIYCVGAGMRGVSQVVHERGLADDLVIIGHDLTSHSRAALESGVADVIINQNAGHIVRSAARVLKAQCDGVDLIASQEKIRIEIVLRENLP